MEWWAFLAILVGCLTVMLASGVPVAFAFMVVDVAAVFFMSGAVGLQQLIHSFVSATGSFTLLPIPLFILMGEVMFQSGIGPRMMDTIEKWMGRIPGRLGLVAVGGGTLFATLSGSSLASVAMLGTILVPEMEKRHYKKSMSLGPILGSGGLAIMIPPSSFAVILASLAMISIGKLLIAIVLPGLLLAFSYATYIVLRCWLQPSLAPSYDAPNIPFRLKVVYLVRYVLPLSFIILLVTGFIFLGVATPSEAAAVGATGCYVLAAFYKKLNWQLMKKSLLGTGKMTVMIFMVIASALTFSQVLAFSGATRGMIEVAMALPVPPIMIIFLMQLIMLAMGCFIDGLSIMMICTPIFFPIVKNLGFDPTWFAVMMMINIEMASITPPFGICMYVMKSVATPDTTMEDIYLAGLPFLGCDFLVMIAIMFIPSLVLWVPSLM
jgi:tripartite ATP-independent transporter DctM subunit